MTTATESSSVEQRLQRLEDIEAINVLTATYAHSVDRGCNGKKIDTATLPSLFADDATWRYPAQGVDLAGKDAILKFLADEGGIHFAMHSFTNPVITVSGDTAHASYLLWVAIKGADGVANEVFQDEDLTYVRTPRGWVIKSIDLHFGEMLLT